MKNFHKGNRIMCLSGLSYFSFDEAVLMNNLYLQSGQKFQFSIYTFILKEDGQFPL